MWAEPNETVFRDARAKWRLPKWGAIVRWQSCSTLCGMFVQPFYLVSYYFSWIEYDDFFFHFQETYNIRLRERYGDDPSTHPDFDPDLWMKVVSSGGPDKNWVYELSNTTFISSNDALRQHQPQIDRHIQPQSASDSSNNVLRQHHPQTNQQIQLKSATDSCNSQLNRISDSELPGSLDALQDTRRVSLRTYQPPSRMQDYVTYSVRYPISRFVSYHRLSPTHSAFLTYISNVYEPKSFKEAQSQTICDTTKRLMSSPKCRSVEVINNPAKSGSNHREVNYINYK
jgi:hypothetical protein